MNASAGLFVRNVDIQVGLVLHRRPAATTPVARNWMFDVQD